MTVRFGDQIPPDELRGCAEDAAFLIEQLVAMGWDVDRVASALLNAVHMLHIKAPTKARRTIEDGLRTVLGEMRREGGT